MKQIPKHAELIKLWADGALIQWKNEQCGVWKDCHNNLPTWAPRFNYRVKPKDVVKYAVATKTAINFLGGFNTNPMNNVMFVFDGETGVLKDVQLLAKE